MLTSTVTVMKGYIPPAGSTSLRLHVFPAQFHPGPDIDISVKPAGTVSVIATVPLVGPANAEFMT
jgi:hypothetical protein